MTIKEPLSRPAIYEAYLGLRNVADEVRWNLSGRPLPAPHVVKKETVIGYACRYGLHTLVETGTIRG